VLAAQEPHHGVTAPATGLYALVRCCRACAVSGARSWKPSGLRTSGTMVAKHIDLLPTLNAPIDAAETP